MEKIPDFMWNEMKKAIPKKKSNVGRPQTPSRKILDGIFFILKTGIQWKYLPKEFGAPSTVHGRFRKWIKMGIFEEIMELARKIYAQSKNEPILWFATDTSYSKAPFASKWGGKNPTDRGRYGVKKSIVVDFEGAILAVEVGPANKHDSKFFENTFSHIKKWLPGKAKMMAADSAYDCQKIRKLCRKNNFILLAATNIRRNKKKEKYNPSSRWVVERTFGWLAWYRSLKTCWSKTKESFLAFLSLAASVQLFKMLGVFG